MVRKVFWERVVIPLSRVQIKDGKDRSYFIIALGGMGALKIKMRQNQTLFELNNNDDSSL